jgi:hypothetical protein
MDPHKRSVTIEVMDAKEHVLGGGRFATEAAGYRLMLGSVDAWPDRVWTIEQRDRLTAQRRLFGQVTSRTR